LALVGLLLFPLLFVANVIYSRRMSPRIAHAQALRAQLSARAHESFDGALLVKTMGREEYEAARFAHHAGELRDALIRVGRVRGLFDPLIEALPSVGTLAALMVGAYRLQAGAVSVADVVSVAFLFTILGFPVRAIGWVLGDLPRAVIGYERIQRVLSARATMHYGTAELAGAGPASLRLAGVGFGYRPDLPVLHDVSFEVPAGQIVALVGPTGSGKSTIAALAARLIDPGQGTVSLDAIPVSELSAAALAGVVGLVGQVPFVFDDSVRGNVSLERAGVDDTVIWWALRCAQADHFVQALPDHLDADVGERGTTLSGGQRQRLTLARALAGRPRLLILDDATSAVDPTVEAAILARLREGITDPGPDGGGADGQGADGHRAAGGRIGLAATHVPSLLLIAHRRATIALADSVVFLERGRVIAQGTHTDLLARVPAYADLVTAYEREEDQVAA
jgi:ABC-type multidrug transport system fused ATPase/permease subunit